MSSNGAAAKAAVTEELPSERARRVGEARRKFQEIRLAVPRQHAQIEAMEELRTSSVGRTPGTGTRALRIIQPSGAGKSECAIQFKRFVEGQPGRDPSKTPVHHLTLDTTGTPRSAIVSCLEELGDEYSTDGSEKDLLKRLKRAIEREGIEILIIAELNHCSEKVVGKDVSDTLKNMLTKGWVAIVFCGTSDADKLFKRNKELRGRSHPQLALSPIYPEHAGDLKEWMDFCAGMDGQMVKLKLVKREAGLGEQKLAKALCEACGGLIGGLALVLEDALAEVTRRRGAVITVADLHRAVEIRYVLEGELDANPLDALVR